MSSPAFVPARTPSRIPRRAAPGEVVPRPGNGDGRPRHLRLVDPDSRRRERRRRWIVRVWALGIVAAALLGVMVHAVMAESQMRVADLSERIVVEQRRYEAARLEVAVRSTPVAIVTRARAAGLIPATTTRTVIRPAAVAQRSESAASNSTTPWQTLKPNLTSTP